MYLHMAYLGRIIFSSISICWLSRLLIDQPYEFMAELDVKEQKDYPEYLCENNRSTYSQGKKYLSFLTLFIGCLCLLLMYLI